MITDDRNQSHFFEYGDRMLISVPYYVLLGQPVYAVLDDDWSDKPEERVGECFVTEIGSRGFWTSSYVPPQHDMGEFISWDQVGKDVFFSREDAINKILQK